MVTAPGAAPRDFSTKGGWSELLYNTLAFANNPQAPMNFRDRRECASQRANRGQGDGEGGQAEREAEREEESAAGSTQRGKWAGPPSRPSSPLAVGRGGGGEWILR